MSKWDKCSHAPGLTCAGCRRNGLRELVRISEEAGAYEEPELHCDWTMCCRKYCVACYPPPKPAAPTWAVGDYVQELSSGCTGTVRGIHNDMLWVVRDDGTPIVVNAHQLTRPAPKRRTVTVYEHRLENGELFWGSEPSPVSLRTGRTHQFEVDET